MKGFHRISGGAQIVIVGTSAANGKGRDCRIAVVVVRIGTGLDFRQGGPAVIVVIVAGNIAGPRQKLNVVADRIATAGTFT